jgi:DNA-binding GntR family transcriptional regulator
VTGGSFVKKPFAEKPKNTISSRIELLPKPKMAPLTSTTNSKVQEADLSKLLEIAEKQNTA